MSFILLIIKYNDFKKKYLIIWLAIFIGIVLVLHGYIIEKEEDSEYKFSKI